MEDNTNINVNEETNTENKEVKTYTQDEVLALIQSESDKRVSQALKTQQAKYEKQLSLSKLDGNEREKAEKDNRIAELEELVAQMNIEKNKSELKSVLGSRGLSAEFADIIKMKKIILSLAKITVPFQLFMKIQTDRMNSVCFGRKRESGNAA